MTTATIGNDKSGVFIEVFSPPRPEVLSVWLSGFFKYMKKRPEVKKSKMTTDGYYLDFDIMSCEIYDHVAKSLSDSKRRSFLIKFRVNPIRVANNNSLFNFIRRNFSFDDTKQVFQSCFGILKKFFEEFASLCEDDLRLFLFPDKVRISYLEKAFFNNVNYGEIYINDKGIENIKYTQEDFYKFLRDRRTFTEYKDLFCSAYIEQMQMTDWFELSITADIHLDSLQEKTSFFQLIENAQLPLYSFSVYPNESVRFSPYDKSKSKDLTAKLPIIRAYLKLNSVLELAQKRYILIKNKKDIKLSELFRENSGAFFSKNLMESLKIQQDDVKRIYKAEKELISQERGIASEFLKHTVRLEIDFRQNRAIKEKYKTADFHKLGFDNRSEIVSYFKEHFIQRNKDVTMEEAIEYILTDGFAKKKSKVLLKNLLNVQGIPFKKQLIVLGLEATEDTFDLSSSKDETQFIRSKVNKLRRASLLLGTGQNVVVLAPYRQALDYINTKEDLDSEVIFKSILEQHYEPLEATQSSIYNNILINNITKLNNLSLSSRDNNILTEVRSSNNHLNNSNISGNKTTLVVCSATPKILQVLKSETNYFHEELLDLGFSEELISLSKTSGDIFEIKPGVWRVL